MEHRTTFPGDMHTGHGVGEKLSRSTLGDLTCWGMKELEKVTADQKKMPQLRITFPSPPPSLKIYLFITYIVFCLPFWKWVTSIWCVGHGNPQTTKSLSKAISCSLQIDYSVLVQNTTPSKFIEHGEVEQEMTCSLHPYGQVFRVLWGTVHTTKEER